MKYENMSIEIIMIEKEDILTLSNGGANGVGKNTSWENLFPE